MRKTRFFYFILIFLLILCQACSAPTNDDDKIVIDGIEYHFYDYDDEPYYYVYKAQNKNITSVAIEE